MGIKKSQEKNEWVETGKMADTQVKSLRTINQRPPKKGSIDIYLKQKKRVGQEEFTN